MLLPTYQFFVRKTLVNCESCLAGTIVVFAVELQLVSCFIFRRFSRCEADGRCGRLASADQDARLQRHVARLTEEDPGRFFEHGDQPTHRWSLVFDILDS